jgi:hypothetical protein
MACGLWPLLLVLLIPGCKKENAARASSGAARAGRKGPPLAEFRRQDTVEAYRTLGNRNPKWDEFAEEALDALARMRVTDGDLRNQHFQNGQNAARTAIGRGCDDPLVRYAHVVFTRGEAERADAEAAKEWAEAGDALEQSAYSHLRKFYGTIRAAQALNASKTESGTPQKVHEFRHHAAGEAGLVVADTAIPSEEIGDVILTLFDTVRNNVKQRDDDYNSLEANLFDNWSDIPESWLYKGEFYTQYAWEARGTAFANQVQGSQWKTFKERLAVSEKALEKSWEIKPLERTAIAMINLEVGQGKGRDRMEMWFQRAMKINSNSFDACYSKLYYIEPKWYGSAEDMLEFGHECVVSTNWGGRVPHIIVNAHDTLAGYASRENAAQRDLYWSNPKIWPELKEAFEKLSVRESGYRHEYFLYAYKCGQWEEMLRQLPLLGAINYTYFGGREQFDKMVATAKEKTGH